MSLALVPVTREEARRFVGQHHRHNLPPKSWKFGVGVAAGGQLVGVGIAGRPVARLLDDGSTIEVVRVCTDGTPNACSMLYGALARAARALGFRRIITYTLGSEPGTSLLAAGWEREAELPARPGWDNGRHRVTVDLFGQHRTPPGPKVRWVKVLGPSTRSSSRASA